MRFGSMFTGIEGFGEAFRHLGWTCAWQIENDKRCIEVLRYRWPDVTRYGDIQRVKANSLADVDLICGGFPCTDISVAGRRAGLAGKRSGLFFDFLRIVATKRPAWVWIENVPGLLSSWGDEKVDSEGRIWQRNDFERVTSELANLGYWWASRILDAQFFGVAQRRERVFIIGYAGNMGGLSGTPSREFLRRIPGVPARVLFEPQSCTGDTTKGKQKRQDITRTLAQGSNGSGYRLDASHEEFIAVPALRTNREQPLAEVEAYQCQGSNVGPAGTLRRGNGSDSIPFFIQETTPPLTTRYNAGMDGGSRGAPIVPALVANSKQGSNSPMVVHEATTALTCGDRGVSVDQAAGGNLVAVFDGKGDPRGNEGEVVYALDTKRNAGFAFTQNSRNEVRLINGDGDITGNLSAQPGAQQQNYVMTDEPVYAMVERGRPDGRNLEFQEDVAFALTAPTDGGRTGSRQVAGSFGVRRLTPVETERLQAFPDDHTKYGIRIRANNKPFLVTIKNSARYKMTGNAVCVSNIYWIARRLDLEDGAMRELYHQKKGTSKNGKSKRVRK